MRCPSIQLIMGLTLIVLFVILMRNRANEGFQAATLDLPSPKDLLDPPVNALEANDGFRKTLKYLQTNPTDSSAFLNFLKSSFFMESSQFNPDMNFSTAYQEWKEGRFKDKSTDV